MSMAELQGMFLLHKDDLESLINAVKDLNLNNIDPAVIQPGKVDVQVGS